MAISPLSSNAAQAIAEGRLSAKEFRCHLVCGEVITQRTEGKPVPFERFARAWNFW